MLKKLSVYLLLLIFLLAGCAAPVLPAGAPAPEQTALPETSAADGRDSAAPVSGPNEQNEEQPADDRPGYQEPVKPADQAAASGNAPAPAPSQPTEAADEAAYTCTISVSCAALLDNWEQLDPDKAELVPEGGVILAPTAVEFSAGESVFDVLSRALKSAGIQLEAVNTPLYDSVYIEGINNIYELDCGPLSGWNYQVNGLIPQIGCSRYTVENGDIIEFLYTCDLGRDL